MIRRIIKLALSLTPFAALVLIILEFVVTNELAGLGSDLMATDSRIEQVKSENIALRQEVASASSLMTIRQKATELGLTESPRYIVIGREEFALSAPR